MDNLVINTPLQVDTQPVLLLRTVDQGVTLDNKCDVMNANETCAITVLATATNWAAATATRLVGNKKGKGKGSKGKCNGNEGGGHCRG